MKNDFNMYFIYYYFTYLLLIGEKGSCASKLF